MLDSKRSGGLASPHVCGDGISWDASAQVVGSVVVPAVSNDSWFYAAAVVNRISSGRFTSAECYIRRHPYENSRSYAFRMRNAVLAICKA